MALAVPELNGPEKGIGEGQSPVAYAGWPPAKLAMAALFAKGLKKRDVVAKFKAIGADPKTIRTQMRRWKADHRFTDLIWELSMEDMRLAEPTVVMALLRKAQRGDVLAAKFFLELTGRYTPKPENIQASQINLILPEGIQRPTRTAEQSQTDEAATIRAEVLEAT